MTYLRLKKMILNGSYIEEEILEMMDVFLLRNRITKEQYDELYDLIKKQEK